MSNQEKQIQISKIAKEVNRQSGEILDYLKRIGVEVGGVMSKVDETIYQQILNHFKSSSEEAKINGTKDENSEEQEENIKDVKIFNENVSYKSNLEEFREIINKYGIKQLYHFTDEENVESIKKNGGLYSWYSCKKKGITIKKQASNDLSRSLDTGKGLQNYIRLSFNPNHPMLYVVKKSGKINAKILEIDTDIIYWEDTLFSDVNATTTGSNVGGSLEDLQKIDYKIVLAKQWVEDEKAKYQAEVLVKEHIPLKFIKNL